MEPQEEKRHLMTEGGRNLFFLGLIAIFIAMVTSGVSLAVYHNSGDIYLDRSRPGYLPDENEQNNDIEEDYVFEKTGKLTVETIEEYLDKLEIEVKAIDSYEDPFFASALSDERLEIPED